MSDDFYGVFDRECFRDAFNPERRHDYRSVFQQDLGRILFTGAFRRLQAKTQVFQAGEYDFYRTRLTHSLDVASVAESIAVWLATRHPEVRVDSHLLEAICLAHDIGHPPFGHAGERVLNELMEPYGGFEGNAQTLRILTRTIYSNPESRGGMSPSRALLDGVLKYKRLHRDRGGDTHHFIYDDQAEILDFCFGGSDLAARLGGADVNGFRSLECQIMDLADDVAYSCFDIVDGTNARFLTPERLRAWRERNDPKLDDRQRTHLEALIAMMTEGKVEARMNRVIGELIQSASLSPVENFMSGRTRRHAYKIVIEPLAESRIDLHKMLCRELVFGSSELQQMEFKGGRILRQLGQMLFQNYLETQPAVLVPNDVHRAVLGAKTGAEGARLLCDYLSGMTDAYAVRSYKRLLDPDYGSISELI
ncbi:MAG TPA: dNTP triphosphohydrolase [Candidatus Methylacidiphilales bacterium]|jgi:dGTPase|nr:dNTP triphosphohydrolase [Candidatus Methylacidiphilales bacterium]